MALYLNVGEWTSITASYTAGVGTEFIVAGTTIWTPPARCVIRYFTINDDSGNALTGAGGATTLSIGTPGFLTNLVSATGFASYATVLLGTGFNGVTTNTADGLVLGPAGSFPGRASLSRVIQGGTNAGTATGTVHFRFQAWFF